MLKKSIIGLICAAVVMPTVSFAEANSQESIDVTVTGCNIFVRYSGDEDFGKATVMMKDDSNNLIYMSEQKTTTNTKAVDFAQFKVNDNLPTDTYTISVGVNGNILSKELPFKNPFDRERTFVDMISATDKNALRAKIAPAANEIDELDYAKYSAYDETTQLQIAQGIYELGLINRYTPALAETPSNVETLIAEFNTYIAKAFEAADIMTAQTASVATALIDNAQSLAFDKTYFDSQYVYNKDDISNYIVSYDFAQYSNIYFDKLYDVFNGNCLLYVINNNDFTTGKAALDYYKNDTYMNVNYAYYNTLSLLQQSSVFDTLKLENIADYTQIPARFLSISQSIAGASGEGSQDTQGSSGGGGGGGMIISGILNAGNNKNEEEEEVTDTTLVFNDIAYVSWAHEAITQLKAIGAINGDGTGNYNPDNSVKRNEFIKITVATFNYLDNNAECNFNDVAKDDWSYPYIASAYNGGLVNGESSDYFGAKSNITREDAAVILFRLYTKTRQAPTANATFEDSNFISDYAKEAVLSMAQLGIINGYDNKFHPKKNLTRAECAKLIYEVYKILEG